MLFLITLDAYVCKYGHFPVNKMMNTFCLHAYLFSFYGLHKHCVFSFVFSFIET